MGNDNLAPAVSRVVDIIELFTTANRGFGVNEIARILGIPVNTVYRICVTMEEKGWFSKDKDTAAYQLSSKFFTIGQTVGSRIELRKLALPIMEQLSKELEETVHLCILQKGWLVLLDQVETKHPIRVHVDCGSLMYPHASAFGKCLLAYDNPENLRQIERAQLTAKTITDPHQLQQHIAEIAAQKYALDLEEYMDGVRCVGAPIHDRKQKGIAAIGVMAPAYRLTDTQLQEVIPIVQQAAEQLSTALGDGSEQ